MRRFLRPVYLECLQTKYGIRWDSPKAAKLMRLSEHDESEIVDNLAYLAQSQSGDAPEVVAEKTLTIWFANNGSGDFLRKTRHPLARFAEDVGLIVCNILNAQAPKRQSHQPAVNVSTERVVPLVALIPEIRQNNVAGGRTLLAAMGARRPDFQKAANA